MKNRQKRFLAVDQGNTFLKLTLFEGSRLAGCRSMPTDAFEELFAVVEDWKPESGAFCSVGKFDSRMVESLRLALDGNLLIFSRSTSLPVGVDYATPETLGLDRLALAAGGASLYPGECLAIVDAGTAVTLDVVDASATFRGGRITSGMRLRFDSLHRHTAALPLVSSDGNLALVGRDTVGAIRSGVVLGLADEITETFKQYKMAFGCTRLLLTGGDAEVLIGCINTRIPADHVPDLMARGLLYIYNYNEIKD